MANIITIAEYRDFDDLPSPAEDEEQITTAISAATSYIEKKTGRTFEIAGDPSQLDSVEILNGNGTSRLYTRNAPVANITKLEYWNGTAWQEYDIVTYPHSFKVGSNIIYFTQGHTFYQGWQNIRATFEYGYTTVFPNDLKLACYQIAKYIAVESERFGINRQGDGEQTFWYDHTMPKQALEIVKRFKTAW